jgi:hypothetical protein
VEPRDSNLLPHLLGASVTDRRDSRDQDKEGAELGGP